MNSTFFRGQCTILLGVIVLALSAAGCGTEKLGKKEYAARMERVSSARNTIPPDTELIDEKAAVSAQAVIKIAHNMKSVNAELREFEPDDPDAARTHKDLVETCVHQQELLEWLANRIQHEGVYEAMYGKDFVTRNLRLQEEVGIATRALVKDGWLDEETAIAF